MKGKKILAWLLTVAMVLTMLPTVAFADTAVQSAGPEVTTNQVWDSSTKFTANTSKQVVVDGVKVTIRGTVSTSYSIYLKNGASIEGEDDNAVVKLIAPTGGDTQSRGSVIYLPNDKSDIKIENITATVDSNYSVTRAILLLDNNFTGTLTLDNVSIKGSKVSDSTDTSDWKTCGGGITWLGSNCKIKVKNSLTFSDNSPTDINLAWQTDKSINPFVFESEATVSSDTKVWSLKYDSKDTVEIPNPVDFATGDALNETFAGNFKTINDGQQISYADGKLWIGPAKAVSQYYSINLGTPTNATVSGALTQSVAKNGGTIQNVTVTPSAGCSFTGVDISALTKALDDTGLNAAVNADGAIVISGKPTKDVNLSGITWPTPVASKTITLGNSTDLAGNGLELASGSGSLTQTLTGSNTFNAVKIKAKGGKMPLTEADVTKIKSALGNDLSKFNVTLNGNDGTITIAQATSATFDNSINVNIVSALSTHDDIVAKINDTPYDNLGTAIGEVGNGYTVKMVKNPSAAVSEATLANGATLKDVSDKTYKAVADGTKIGVGTNGAVTLKSGKLEVSAGGSVNATLGDKAYTGITSASSFTVGDNKLTVSANSTATVGNGKFTAHADSAKTFTFDEGGITVPKNGMVSNANDTNNKVTGVADSNTKVTVGDDGRVTLVGGKGESDGKMYAKLSGESTARSFTKTEGTGTYTVDTSAKTLTVPAGTTVTDGAGVKYTGAGTFTFGDDGKVTISDGAKLTDKNNKSITGVGGDPATEVTLNNGEAKLTGGKGSSTGKMDATISGVGEKSFDGNGNSYTVDTASKKLTLNADGSVKMDDKVTFTGKNSDSFTLGTESGNATATIPAGAAVSDGTNTVTGVAKGEGKDTKASIDNAGNVTLIEGKGASTGKMDVKVGGQDMSFDGSGKGYVVDTDGKLTVNKKGDSIKADNAAFTAGKDGVTFELTKDGDGNVTATLPTGSSVKGDADGSSAITGVASSDKTPTKVSVDSTGNVTLTEGAASAPAGGKIVAKIGDKTFDIGSSKAFTADLTKVPPQVGKLVKGDSITVGGITYTCDSEVDDGWFPIESDKAQLKNNGDKAEIEKGSTAIVKLGTGESAVSVIVPAVNSGSTKLIKGEPSTIELGKEGDKFTVGNKTYTAASDGAKFSIGNNGEVTLTEGSASVANGAALGVVTKDTDGNADVVYVTNPDTNINAIKVTSDSPKSSAEVKNRDSVKIGDNTYRAVDEDSTFAFDKDGNVTLASGTTELDKDQKIIGGSSGKEITNAGEGKITIKADDDTVKVPANGKVNIAGTEYDAGENGATIIAGADSNKLSEGSVKMDKPETINVGSKDTPVKNTGGKQIEVTADGKVTVPEEGQTDIGNAKITDVKQDTTFTISSDGNAGVTLKAGETVTINGVTYTGGEGEPGGGSLTIDPATGKVTGVTGNINIAIDEDKLTDDFSYDLVPGQSVTIGKYVYTAPKGGNVGDVTIKGRGKDLNPAVVLKNVNGTADVSLKAAPAIKTTYTAANASTVFAMAAGDMDTKNIELLDNKDGKLGLSVGVGAANSALKFSDKDSHTVNGVTYQAQTVKDTAGQDKAVAYTVTYGTAEVETGDKDEEGKPITEPVNRNTVSVESGSKVIATMNAKDTINIGSGKVGESEFNTATPFTATNSSASIIIDNSVEGGTTISGNGSYLTEIKDAEGKVTGYKVTRYSGGSSSGTDNVVNKAEDKTAGTEATTTATIGAETDNGKTAATVDDTTADKIVDKAVANKSAEVVVNTSTKEVLTEAAAGAVTEIALPEKTVQELSQKTEASVTIKSDAAKVTLNKEAVDGLAAQAGDDGYVRLVVETVKQEPKVMEVELKLVTSKGTVTDFRGGDVSVTVKMNDTLASKNVVCVYIDDYGIYHKVTGSKNADGTYNFITGHFSKYAIMALDEADEIIAEQTAKVKSLTGKIQLKARSVKTKKGNIKVRLKITKGADSFKALEDLGYTLKYKYYRSTKMKKNYKAKFETYGKPYTNTDAKKGTRYYYKARVMVYDSQGELVAKTKLAKCWYATRIR